MKSSEVQVTNKLGLHARASSKLVALASGFESSIELEKNGRRVNAKSIMAVMMLSANCGSMIKIIANGADESLALLQLETLILNKFGEKE